MESIFRLGALPLPRTAKPNTQKSILLKKASAPVSSIDPRHPSYLGNWERSIPNVHDEFAQDDIDEPHLKRKRAILASHPEIVSLYGPEHSTKYIMFATVVLQLVSAYIVGRHTESLLVLLVSAYVVAGSVTALFGVFIHECAHNHMASSVLANRLLALISNVAVVVPIAASFRRYHIEHHSFQGVSGRDADLPLEFEWRLIRGGRLRKLLWVSLFPFTYMLRGLVMRKRPQYWEIVNILWTMMCDIAIAYVCGPRGLLYMSLGLWFGYGVHPGAAHFIQEHYTFIDGQETYSYYGVLNVPMLNIGYHNEHHDFIKVAWKNLPAVNRIAREFYDPLLAHTSWIKVIWDFIMKPDIGPQSRVARNIDEHRKGRKLIASLYKEHNN